MYGSPVLHAMENQPLLTRQFVWLQWEGKADSVNSPTAIDL